MSGHGAHATPVVANPRSVSDALLDLAGLQRNRFIIGGVGLLITLAGFALARDVFFRAWLIAWMLWGGLSLGCMGVLMLHNVVGGVWGVNIRRQLEAGARTVPYLALMFLPILLGLKDLYIWTHADVVAADHLLRHKAAYLNPGAFMIRMAVYFVIWSFLSYRLTGLLKQHDATGDLRVAKRIRQLCGPGLAIYVLTMTFASIDWVMSLEPHWYSTIFGIWFVVGQALSCFAFMIPMTVWLAGRKPLSDRVTKGGVYDLGNLTFAFTMLWSYMALSQLLIIWAGNLPEEIPWYLKRFSNGWGFVALAVVLGQFALPFLMLISRPTKSHPKILAGVAIWVFCMRWVDLYWMIGPAVETSVPLRFHWLYLTAPIGFGGLWIGLFLSQLKTRWQDPFRDVHAHFNEPAAAVRHHVGEQGAAHHA